jgi:hypothetical protein
VDARGPAHAALDGPTYLTLKEAARLAPGKPSASAVWRWCRKGLTARDGSKVYLKHVRVGREVYTSAAWLHAFFEAVATADQAHFQAKDAIASDATRSVMTAPPPQGASDAHAASTPFGPEDDLEAALREEGL